MILKEKTLNKETSMGLIFFAFFSLSLAFFSLSLTTPAPAKPGLDDFALNSILGKTERGEEKSAAWNHLCSKNKICQNFRGSACERKIVFSVCWLFCKAQRGFGDGVCTKASPAPLNVKKETFSDGQTPSAYLVDVIKSESKSHLEADLLCEGVCKVARLKKERLFSSAIEGLKDACLKGCLSGK